MRLPAHVTLHEQQWLRTLLSYFQGNLRFCNPYVRVFQMACEMQAGDVEQQELIIHARPKLGRNHADHPGRYNQPSGFKEISVYMSDVSEPTDSRDIALRVRQHDSVLQIIPETHRAADALHYPTLFPLGDDGWHLDLLRRERPTSQRTARDSQQDEGRHEDDRRAPQYSEQQASEVSQRSHADRRVTAREYYAYRLQQH